MSEHLEWKKRKGKPELAKTLERLVTTAVSAQIQDLHSKIECLCQMGVIKEGPELQNLRNKIKQLEIGMKNGS
jgi:hypothetical protein